MTLLIIGLTFWVGAHFLPRVAPQQYADLGKAGRGIMAGMIGAGLLLIIFGFRGAPHIDVYTPPEWGRHLNNLMVLIAFYFFAASGSKNWLHRKLRHPMLMGVGIWALAHLLVNGDLASILLFGVMLVWAMAEIAVINRAQPEWERPPVASRAKEIRAVVITLVVFAVAAGIHTMLGYNPFA